METSSEYFPIRSPQKRDELEIPQFPFAQAGPFDRKLIYESNPKIREINLKLRIPDEALPYWGPNETSEISGLKFAKIFFRTQTDLKIFELALFTMQLTKVKIFFFDLIAVHECNK